MGSRVSGLCAQDVKNVNVAPVHDLCFPMYLMKVSDFLQEVPGPPQAHDQVRAKLHAWRPGMFVIFVSHQWLGTAHPDPLGEQMSVLRGSLRGLVDGSQEVVVDVISAFKGQTAKSFTPKMRKDVAEGYIFLDWFAIPQVTSRQEGVNEDTTRSKAALAVQSIPAYVEMCNLFVALVPELRHRVTQETCNYASWLSRGWCRAELWCHLLSNKVDTSVIVVHSSKEAEYMFPLDWQYNSVATGAFTVEADRQVVTKLAQLALDSKIEYLAAPGTSSPSKLALYRFYLACRHRMLGQEPVALDLYNFLRCYRFETFQQAVQESSHMNGLLCALLAEDVQMLRLLLRYKADVNTRLYGLTALGYFDNQTLLMAAVKSNQNITVVKTLLDHRADPNLLGDEGESAVFLARSPLHIKLLIEAKADLHGGSSGLIPLVGVASYADSPTLFAMLAADCDPNPPLTGFGFSPLHGLVLFSRRNRQALLSAQMLLKHRADVNCQARPQGRTSLLCHAARAHCALMGFAGSSMVTRCLASLPGITPLGMCAMVGDLALTKLLLESGAELLPNDRGDSPEQLAKHMGHQRLLPQLVATFST